jgi:hypothetical protein
VVCSGHTITNNSGNTVTGNIYQGCENGNKIGSFTLANGQSKSASDCNQIDIPGYCGVCNPSNCQSPSQPTQKPASTATPAPTKKPTSTPTPTSTLTPSPTGTPKPTATRTPNQPTPTNTPIPINSPTASPQPTQTPTLTPTPTPTSVPNSTPTPVIVFRPPSYVSPIPPVLPQAGINLPVKALTIFGTIVTLLGFLVLL